MPEAKSPEEILTEFGKQWVNDQRGGGIPLEVDKDIEKFIRSALASVILWAAEQEMPNKQSYGLAFTAVPAYQRFLKSLAESISKEV